jgi:hypothetical protein
MTRHNIGALKSVIEVVAMSLGCGGKGKRRASFAFLPLPSFRSTLPSFLLSFIYLFSSSSSFPRWWLG